jgi:hypothetical protein
MRRPEYVDIVRKNPGRMFDAKRRRTEFASRLEYHPGFGLGGFAVQSFVEKGNAGNKPRGPWVTAIVSNNGVVFGRGGPLGGASLSRSTVRVPAPRLA